jgi:hypothetical protein
MELKKIREKLGISPDGKIRPVAEPKCRSSMRRQRNRDGKD